jgi:alpha-glucosidase (family GH31 glycosyl hydrolase)
VKVDPVSGALTFALVLGALGIARGAGAQEQTLLEEGGVRLTLDGPELRLRRGSELLLDATALEFNYVAPRSLQVTGASADRVVLEAVYPSVAKYREEGGDATVGITLSRVDGGFRLYARPEWAHNVTIRLRDMGEHYFGLLEALYPDNRRSPDLRGNVVDVEVVGEQSEYYENYASAYSAFFMSSRGYASFFDSFARGRYRLGIDGTTEIAHRTGTLDWYLFVGKDGDEQLASYYRVIGAPRKLPAWALGPCGWRDQDDGGAPQILDDLRQMTALRIPFTSWFVDRPYSDGALEWSKMDFGAKFAHPEQWIKEIRDVYGLEFMTWIAPQTFDDPDFPGLLDGPPRYIDLSDATAVQELERRVASQQYAFGVRGHKMDRADQLFPFTIPWKDGTRENESRNKFVYLYAKVTDDMLRKAWGDDSFSFARAAIHRVQPHLSAIWNGDSRSSWSGLASSLANAVRAGFMGFPVWGSDVGGYLGGRIDEELYARWLQLGALSGLFEIKIDGAGGRGQDRPPWAYDARLQGAFRAACERRMELIPYLYSLANGSARHGVMMKPLAYVWPGDPMTYDVADEYLLGPALLVAPIVEPGGRRTVYLPAGRWRRQDDAARVLEGGRSVEVELPLEVAPVFERQNAIYVTGEVPLGNARAWKPAFATKRTVTLRAWPGAPGERTSFEYLDLFDSGRSKTLRLSHEGHEVRVEAEGLGSAGTLLVRTDERPSRVASSGRPAALRYDPASGAATIPFAAGRPLDIVLTLP